MCKGKGQGRRAAAIGLAARHRQNGVFHFDLGCVLARAFGNGIGQGFRVIICQGQGKGVVRVAGPRQFHVQVITLRHGNAFRLNLGGAANIHAGRDGDGVGRGVFISRRHGQNLGGHGELVILIRFIIFVHFTERHVGAGRAGRPVLERQAHFILRGEGDGGVFLGVGLVVISSRTILRGGAAVHRQMVIDGAVVRQGAVILAAVGQYSVHINLAAVGQGAACAHGQGGVFRDGQGGPGGHRGVGGQGGFAVDLAGAAAGRFGGAVIGAARDNHAAPILLVTGVTDAAGHNKGVAGGIVRRCGGEAAAGAAFKAAADARGAGAAGGRHRAAADGDVAAGAAGAAGATAAADACTPIAAGGLHRAAVDSDVAAGAVSAAADARSIVAPLGCHHAAVDGDVAAGAVTAAADGAVGK